MIHFYEFNFYSYPLSISIAFFPSFFFFYKQIANNPILVPNSKNLKIKTNRISKKKKKNRSNEYFFDVGALKNCKFSIKIGEERERKNSHERS